MKWVEKFRFFANIYFDPFKVGFVLSACEPDAAFLADWPRNFAKQLSPRDKKENTFSRSED